MKKLFVLLSAFALFGLVSCTQSEELTPGKDGVKNEVKTSFTINVATKTQTKATATEVQDGTAFRGMANMKLYVLKTGNNAWSSQDPEANYQYDLGALTANEISASQSSKVYSLSIPLGVNNMFFYGRAKVSSTAADKAQYGSFKKYELGATKSAIRFEVEPIVSDLTDFNTTSAAIAAILNDVIAANGWADLATSTDVMMKPLKDLYLELTTIKTGEFRDGSGAGVLRTLVDLRTAAKKIVSPAAAKTIADAIVAKVDTYVTEAGAYETPEYADFPGSLGLPNGAAQLSFANNAFSYVTSSASLGNEAAGVPVDNFIYPAELTYWVSSPIRVTDQDVVETDYPKTVTTWTAQDWGTKWPTTGINGTVGANTRGVALQHNIQYGVAVLKTTVKYAGTTVADNRKAILRAKDSSSTEEDMVITVDGNSFKLNGILVGGQPLAADWQWLPTGSYNTNVVYDHYMTANGPAAIPASGASTPVYTMVLDNYNSGGNQDVVYVALELKNNTGKDFYGRDNLIPKDGIFYMVGKLDLNATSGVNLTNANNNYPTDRRFPPFATDGTNSKVLRVFMQDFVTSANFTITNLHGAYSTVPDLRSVAMTFGLSVDLDWTAGASFDINLQ